MNTPESYEHYRRIRTDPLYRIQEQLEDMRVMMMPPLYAVPREEALQQVVPEHRLMNKVKELEGITYNTRQIIQEHTSKKKKTSYTIK